MKAVVSESGVCAEATEPCMNRCIGQGSAFVPHDGGAVASTTAGATTIALASTGSGFSSTGRALPLPRGSRIILFGDAGSGSISGSTEAVSARFA